MDEPLLAAALQLSSQDDVAANLERALALAHEAVRRGARLVVLPENFAFFGEEETRRTVAEPLDGGLGTVGQALSRAARELKATIVAGGMAERSGDEARPYNTCAVFAPDGSLAARYRKMHLFDVELSDGARYRESSCTTPGDAPGIVHVAPFTVGLSICYDLRFPELYRALVDRGADLLVVPAAFTLATGKDHWHPLLRARAIESQAYVVAAAQWGKHPRGRVTYGKSLIVDPWGEVIAQASEGEGMALAPLEPAVVRRVRASLPSLQHRRL